MSWVWLGQRVLLGAPGDGPRLGPGAGELSASRVGSVVSWRRGVGGSGPLRCCVRASSYTDSLPVNHSVVLAASCLFLTAEHSVRPSPMPTPGPLALPCTTLYLGRLPPLSKDEPPACPLTLSSPPSPYLSERPLEGAEFVAGPGRNADHGGEGQEPAQGIAPPRVFVLLVVGQRGVLDQGEEEGGLRVRAGETGLGEHGSPTQLGQSTSSLHPQTTQNPYPRGDISKVPTLSLQGPRDPGRLYTWLALSWDLVSSCEHLERRGGASIPWLVISPVGVQGRC